MYSYCGVSVLYGEIGMRDVYCFEAKDIRIETYRSSSRLVKDCDNAVKATHIPTGISAISETKTGQHANRKNALDHLDAIIKLKISEQLNRS